MSAVDVKRVVLQAEATGELTGTRIWSAAWFGRQGDHLRQLRMLRPALADDAADVGRIVSVRSAIISLGAKGKVRHVAGEVIIITSMMIAGCLTAICNLAYDREMLALFGRERQMLADIHARRSSLNRIEGATVVERRFGLHVPHVDVRRAATKKKKYDGFGGVFLAAQRIGRRAEQGVRRKLEPACCGRGSYKKCASIHAEIFNFLWINLQGIWLEV